jgi:hypothetical protein
VCAFARLDREREQVQSLPCALPLVGCAGAVALLEHHDDAAGVDPDRVGLAAHLGQPQDVGVEGAGALEVFHLDASLVSERNTCEIVVGRLLEVKLVGGLKSVADVDELLAAMYYWMQDRDAVVVVADWRVQKVMSPETAARVTDMLSDNNAKLVRSAVLTGAKTSSAVTSLQLLRLIGEAENPNRKQFNDVDQLCAWLDEVLDDAESARLRAFLNG